MANGIDSIYDPSDVSRMLAELREQRLQMEEARARKVKGATKVGTSAWKLWSGEQIAQTKELLASKDYMRDPDLGWLKKQVTPAGGRVIPTKSALAKPDFEDIRGPKTISESIKQPTSSIKELISGYFSKTGTLASKGSGLGGGIGAGLSLYETVSDWEKHDPKQRDIRRGIDIGKTGLYAASMVPGPHSPFALAGAGVLTLADLLWS